MDNIIIQAYFNRKLSKKTVDIGNMQENKVTKLIFELDKDIVSLGGNVYLFVSYDGETYPYPLTDNAVEIGRELTQRSKTLTNLVVSTSKDSENLLDGAVWISNTLTLLADKNNINIDSINEQELPPSLKIVYDNLLNLQKDLEEKRDNGHWQGKDGKSAYQYAKDGGYTGTEEEFITSVAEVGEFKYSKADAIVCSASGDTILTTDSAKAKPKNIKPYGKSKQNTVPGNQLFDASFRNFSGTIWKSGCSSISEENGVFTFVASATDMYAWNVISTGSAWADTNVSCNLMEIPEGTTKISVSFSDTTFCKNYVTWFDENKISLGYENKNESEFTVTPKDGAKYFTIRFGKNDAVVGQTYQTTVMVNFGEPMDWEPFVDNEPSPSINYTQPINHLGESGSIEQKILAANMFNEDTAILSGDPKLRFPLTVGSFVWVKTDIEVKQGDVFYIYYSINGVFNAQSAFYINSVMASSGGNITKVTNNIAHITWDGVLFVRMDLIAYDGTETVDNLVISKVPITEFEDYSEQPITFQTPNGLKGVPLGTTIPSYIASSEIHMSGVYWDEEEGQYYISDTKNENGKDVQRIGEIVFDGSDDEGWEANVTKKWVWAPINNSYEPSTVHEKYALLFTHETPTNMNLVTNGYKGVCISKGYLRIYNSSIADGTANLLVASLQKNPATLYYVLANPIITDTSEEELAQLDSVTMNYPNTTIINSDNAYMEVEYVADTKKYIDKQLLAIKEAIV